MAVEPATKAPRQSKRDWSQIAGTVLFVLLVGSVIFAAVRLNYAPTTSDDPDTRLKSEYVLMIIQCVLGIGLLFLPGLLQKRFSIRLPQPLAIAFFAFLFCAIYLGEVRGFYFRIPFWDTILHAFSGAMLGALGLSLVALLNDTKRVAMHLTPFFVSFFGFCFALAAGTVWEIYEFAGDTFFGTNMQKFMTDSGELLVGRAALSDTMKDLIIDGLAALAVVTVGYFEIRRQFAADRLPELLDADSFRLTDDEEARA